jgi:hypothetical protein
VREIFSLDYDEWIRIIRFWGPSTAKDGRAFNRLLQALRVLSGTLPEDTRVQFHALLSSVKSNVESRVAKPLYSLGE